MKKIVFAALILLAAAFTLGILVSPLHPTTTAQSDSTTTPPPPTPTCAPTADICPLSAECGAYDNGCGVDLCAGITQDCSNLHPGKDTYCSSNLCYCQSPDASARDPLVADNRTLTTGAVKACAEPPVGTETVPVNFKWKPAQPSNVAAGDLVYVLTIEGPQNYEYKLKEDEVDCENRGDASTCSTTQSIASGAYGWSVKVVNACMSNEDRWGEGGQINCDPGAGNCDLYLWSHPTP